MRTHDEPSVIDQDQEQAPNPGPTSDANSPARPSRRSFLAMGATAVAVAAGSTAQAQPSRGKGSRPFPVAPAGSKSDAAADWKDPVVRLVRRITMGVSAEEVALARQLGYAGYLEYQLKPEAMDDSAIDTTIAQRLPFTQLGATQFTGVDTNEATMQLQDASLYRAAFSKRQLKERMVEFWTDHFTVSINKVGVLKLVDDRDVIRPNALTTFPQLLKATSQSAAMLVYLDQNQSRTPTPNQNYAREIMELHTLGVDGGYTQNDVAELSRILTGWSVGGGSVFAFNRNFHDRNAKTFLAKPFPAMAATATDVQMKSEGDTAIQMLVDHPSTARYISLKMARWLLAYEPPQSVVDATAAAYTATGGSIPAMIRVILSSQNLMASPAKYKRPFHYTASILRSIGAQVTSIRALRQRADQMGQPMFLWEQPNGYPDRVDWWSGLVLIRWGFASFYTPLTSATAVNVPVTPFTVVNTADGVVNQISARMFGGELPSNLRVQLLNYLRAGTFNEARVREALALAASSTQFQWY